jgi:hypothetical protein
MDKPVVSPYLEEFDAQLFMPQVLRNIPDSDIRHECKTRHETQNAFLFYDHSQRAFWVASRAERNVLKKFWKKPLDFRCVNKEEHSILTSMSKRRLILEEQSAFQFVHPEMAGIEINGHCNFRCRYCPVSFDPLPKAFMSSDTYLIALRRYQESGIVSIALNHYGEPTLDPKLPERIRIAEDFGFAVFLFTNASHLNPPLSEKLAKYSNLSIITNLPTIEPDNFFSITGQRCLPRIIKNLKYAHQLGLKISVRMNLPRNTTKEQERGLRKDFQMQVACLRLVLDNELFSRGGTLQQSEFISRVRHDGKLNGCLRAIVTAHEGSVFLCCNDYRQKHVLGNIRQETIGKMLAAPYSIQLRKWIFGFEESPEDFICRYCEATSSQTDNIISVGAQKDPPHKVIEFYRIASFAEKIPIILDPIMK